MKSISVFGFLFGPLSDPQDFTLEWFDSQATPFGRCGPAALGIKFQKKRAFPSPKEDESDPGDRTCTFGADMEIYCEGARRFPIKGVFPEHTAEQLREAFNGRLPPTG